MDKFLVLLSQGIHVRRHQSHCIAENVKLFSTNGCRTIAWDKPMAKELMSQRQRDGVVTEGNSVFQHEDDRTAFDCCIAGKISAIIVTVLSL